MLSGETASRKVYACRHPFEHEVLQEEEDRNRMLVKEARTVVTMYFWSASASRYRVRWETLIYEAIYPSGFPLFPHLCRVHTDNSAERREKSPPGLRKEHAKHPVRRRGSGSCLASKRTGMSTVHIMAGRANRAPSSAWRPSMMSMLRDIYEGCVG